MTNDQSTLGTQQKNPLAFLLAGRPTVPLPSKVAYVERLFDPSAAVPNGRSYPLPASFEYRIRPEAD